MPKEQEVEFKFPSVFEVFLEISKSLFEVLKMFLSRV